MGLMILIGAERSAALLVLLFTGLGLTIWETRDQNLSRRTSSWWFLLVMLIHVPGYVALRLWGANRQRTGSH